MGIMSTAIKLHMDMISCILLLQVIGIVYGGPTVTTKFVSIESRIDHRFAHTSITAKLARSHNANDDNGQITFRLHLPRTAMVTSLTIDVDGLNYTSSMEEKKKTGADHSRTSSGGHKYPTQRGINIQKFEAMTPGNVSERAIFYVSYEELLQRVKGRYAHRLHLSTFKNAEELSLRIELLESEELTSLKILTTSHKNPEEEKETDQVMIERTSRERATASFMYSKSSLISTTSRRPYSSSFPPSMLTQNKLEAPENLMSQDLPSGIILTYDVRRKPDAGEMELSSGWFVHYFSPEGLPQMPTHTVFVLDVSGSMSDDNKLPQLKVAIEAILRGLRSDDSFEILVFSTYVVSLGVYAASGRDLERGIAKVHRLQAQGGTNVDDAFKQALQGLQMLNGTSTAKQIVFLTDGQATVGERDNGQLRRNVREANRYSYPIYSLAFGKDADLKFLRQVSLDNRGFARQIDPRGTRAVEHLQGFFSEIASPLLTDVEVNYDSEEVDLSTVVRQGPSTFHSGDELVLSGKLREGITSLIPHVKGEGALGRVQFTIPRARTKPPDRDWELPVERLWAYLTVQDLLEAQEIVEDRSLRKEMKIRAMDIALLFNFVTPYTILVLQPPFDEVRQYKDASQHQKSGIASRMSPQDIQLLTPDEFRRTLPDTLGNRVKTSSKAISFVDNDPHFVVWPSGMKTPLCFDLHGNEGDVLSLVKDHKSGVQVNGQVTGSVSRPGNTYFTTLHISLGNVSLIVTPHHVTRVCPDNHQHHHHDWLHSSIWPFNKKRHRHRTRRKHHMRKAMQLRRQVHRRHGRTARRTTRSLHTHHHGRQLVFNRRLREYPHHIRKTASSRGKPNVVSHTSMNSRTKSSTIGEPRVRHAGWRQILRGKMRENMMKLSDSLDSILSEIKTRKVPDHSSRLNNTSKYVPRLNRKLMNGTMKLPKNVTKFNTSDHRIPRLSQSRTIGILEITLENKHKSNHQNTTRENSTVDSFSPKSITSNDKSLNVSSLRNHNDNTIASEIDKLGSSNKKSPSKSNNTEADIQKEPRQNGPTQICDQQLTWKQATGVRHGDVVLYLRNNRQLELVLRDADIHLVITRTKNKHGQHFLGFYIEHQKILSPNTTGIIGQFVFKTVATLPTNSKNSSGNAHEKERIPLAVIHPPGRRKRYEVSQVSGFLSSRRSLLTKTHIDCLFVPDQGRGLLDAEPEDYVRPCLMC